MTGCVSYNTINISVIDLRHPVEEILVNGPILSTDVLSAILLVHFSHNYKSVRRIVFTVDKPQTVIIPLNVVSNYQTHVYYISGTSYVTNDERNTKTSKGTDMTWRKPSSNIVRTHGHETSTSRVFKMYVHIHPDIAYMQVTEL